MEYLTEIGISLIFGILSMFGLRKISQMDKVITDHESRLRVEESKGTARDEVSTEIKSLLHDIAGDISSIKQEQGYWRGRHEQES